MELRGWRRETGAEGQQARVSEWTCKERRGLGGDFWVNSMVGSSSELETQEGPVGRVGHQVSQGTPLAACAGWAG